MERRTAVCSLQSASIMQHRAGILDPKTKTLSSIAHKHLTLLHTLILPAICFHPEVGQVVCRSDYAPLPSRCCTRDSEWGSCCCRFCALFVAPDTRSVSTDASGNIVGLICCGDRAAPGGPVPSGHIPTGTKTTAPSWPGDATHALGSTQ